MNGQTLKLAFLMIVGTLCFLLIALTLCTGIGKLPLEQYVRLVGILGIQVLFGGIVQAFIHANIKDTSSPTQTTIVPPTQTSGTKDEVKP